MCNKKLLHPLPFLMTEIPAAGCSSILCFLFLFAAVTVGAAFAVGAVAAAAVLPGVKHCPYSQCQRCRKQQDEYDISSIHFSSPH